jgi:hypothetical protein
MRGSGRHVRRALGAVGLLAVLAGSGRFGSTARAPDPTPAPWHYAANGNLAADGGYEPGRLGFNLADVSSKSQLDALPGGVRGLVYLDLCGPVDAAFESRIAPFVGDPRIYGFYLIDEPDPRSCSPASLAGESDYIHTHVPGAITFILEQNLSSSRTPSYVGGYTPANTGIDLFGIDPYPCRSELDGCDDSMVARYVSAAVSAGIPRTDIVPVFQAFGGGGWTDDGDGSYLLPTAEQAARILNTWEHEVPSPAFDFVYSWGSQRGDDALAAAMPDVQQVFAAHNNPGLLLGRKSR